MPQRLLRPGILTSLRLARCSPWAQLLYYKLLNLVDDFSRYDAHPLIISRAAFPYGDPKGRSFKEDQLASWLDELEGARLSDRDEPCLTRYTVNGTRYLVLHRWTERIRAGKSRYPSPSQDSTCWQMLSNAVRRQQMFASEPEPEPEPEPSPTYVKGVRNSTDSAKASAIRFKAMEKQVQLLENRKESLTEGERVDLRKKRRELDQHQKNQAAGIFTP